MAVDWELLRSPDEVDQKDAYEHILQVDPNDLDDPEDLRELFDAARQIMKMRIELAELASEKSTALHHRTQEEEEELGELRQKLASAEKQASQVPRLKEENRALGKQVSQLENELDELSNQLHRSQQETDRQLSAKLRDKNAHVAQLLADLQDAEAEKQSLQSQASELAAKLADATLQMDDTADQLTKAQEEISSLRAELQRSQDETEELVRQLESMKKSLSDARVELQMEENELKKEMSTLKEVIIEKDRELAEQRERLSTMEDSYAQIRLDTDHSTVNLLRKALEERERQVKQLSQSLEQATRDLEDQSTIIEALQFERQQRDEENQDGRPMARRGGRWLDLQGKLREKSLLLRSVQSMLSKVEEEARQKDKQLAEAVATARKYELGEYGLSDAVAEIRDLKRQLEIRDREIEKLTSQLNDIEMEVEEECHNDGSASPRHHFRPSRSELEEKIQRLERENRRQRLRLAAQRSITRSTSEVPKKQLLNNFAQTSPLQDKVEKTLVPNSQSPDTRSLSSFHEFKSESINQERIDTPREETSAKNEKLPSVEEKLSQADQLGGQASVDHSKDKIILQQLGHLEAFQEMSAMRIKCLQRRLEESVPKEVFKSLSEAYSKLAVSQARLIARLADAGIADNKLAEVDCASTEKGEWPYSTASDDVKLRILEEENEKLQSMLADRTGNVQVLQGEVARLKHEREMKSNESSNSFSGDRNNGSADEQVESLKMLLERLWTHFQELQKRYEQKDDELLRAMAESRKHSEAEKQALVQLRIQCGGSVPLEKLEGILSQFRSGQQTARNEQEKPSCKNCSALTNTLKAKAEELITSRQNAKLLQKRLDEERRSMKISANSLRVKDTIIQELKQALSRAAAEEPIPWDKAKLKRSLRIAMLTINSLQALMRQKEATIERYRSCVASLRNEMQQQSRKLAAEACVLRAKLLDTASVREKSEHDGEGAAQDKTRHFQDKLDQLRALDEAHKEAVRILLLEAAKVAPAVGPAVETRPESGAEVPRSPVGHVEPEQVPKSSAIFQDTVVSLQKVIEEKDAVILQRDEEITALEGKLAGLNSQLEEAPKRKDLGSLVHTLKSQVDDKEKQLKALSQALVELRTEMMWAVDLHTVTASSGADDGKDTIQLQNELCAAQERERFLEDEVRLLREENETLKEKHRKAQEERLRMTKLHKAPTRRGT
ncbi:uncharacterized protein LOC119165489 isoform X2 [Rhipicephalus microplus]|uniref:uncharacterized protein LOC119165489 isoform X2 n=1 Tax=Rhipicephalus microplus TaxID=6941 RepID=UPI003F6CAA94